MDTVDSIISKHRSRLEEHRKFLESSQSSVSPLVGGSQVGGCDARGADQGFTLSKERGNDPQPHYGTVDSNGGGAANGGVSGAFSPTSLPGVSAPLFGPQRPLLTSAERMERRTTQRVYQALALDEATGADEFHRPAGRSSSFQHHSNNREHSNTYGDSRSGLPAASFYGYAGIHERHVEEDRLLEEQLLAVGRYYSTESPDAMYEKSKDWLLKREGKLRSYLENYGNQSMSECTFRPTREAALALIPKRQLSGAESVLRSDPSTTVLGDVAVQAHLQRLREARERRAEAERRVNGPDISKWSNRPTIAKEFDFSRKVAAIPSLRKPFVPSSGMLHRSAGSCDPPEDPVVGAPGRFSQHGHMESSVPRKANFNETVEVFDMDQRFNSTTGPRSSDGGRREPGGSNRLSCGSAERGEGAPESGAGLSTPCEEVSQVLRQKDEAIQKQQGEIQMLRRELEIVKGAIRKISMGADVSVV